MGCGSSPPQVNETNQFNQPNQIQTTTGQNRRNNGVKQENVKINVSEDPEMQGEKFHEDDNDDGNEEGEESGENGNNGEKDSFDDF